MANAIQLQRKNIDLPKETLQKLSIIAISQGKSLKSYIEALLISKANSVRIELQPNPSPSGDEWFTSTDNIAMLNQGIADQKAGRSREYTQAEINDILGI